jgi:two-component system, cell cycle sensor histidine kinase and response regulator CckA
LENAMTGKSRATILLVDDDQLIRELGRELLERLGHRVLTASDGQEALNLYQPGQVDLVLLDYCLPELDGYQVLSGLRSRDSRVPVLMISGFLSHQETARLDAAGANGFICKPFRLAELKERVRAVLQEQGASR